MDKGIIREALAIIAAANDGKITAEEVVKQASNPTHPLHAFFEWDDGAAAHQWRLAQARGMIRSLKQPPQPAPAPPVAPRMLVRPPVYVRDPDKPASEQGYVSLVSIKSNTDRARDIMYAEMKRVQQALARAQAVANVLGLSDELESLIAHVAAFGRLVPTATEERIPNAH
jgi:hypothetical protein